MTAPGTQLTESLRIETASAAQEETVLSLMVEFYALERLEYQEDAARAALRQLWADPRFGLVFLLYLDDILAGYSVLTWGFSLEFGGRTALLDELYLRREFRDRGVGGRTVAFLEDVCARQGIRALRLEVDRANHGARRLYQRVGFLEHDRHMLTKPLGAVTCPEPVVGQSAAPAGRVGA
jgi:GNAT superfamily N-acetyltransferase